MPGPGTYGEIFSNEKLNTFRFGKSKRSIDVRTCKK